MPENLALELMIDDYLKVLKTIDETLRETYKKGGESCTFSLSPDKTLESWIYDYTQNNGYTFQY
jgi:hypothetical protein